MRWKQLVILCALFLTSCSTGLDAGRKALKSGDYEEAQKQAIIAISTDPRNPEVYYLSSEASLGRGQYDSALKSAEFASALDGGSERAEQLIRKALVGKKAWADLCKAGLRAVQKGQPLNSEEETHFKTALDKLSKKAEAYGCIESLGSLGVSAEDDTIKAAYANGLAVQGLNREAYELEITVSDPAISQLRASRRLFAMQNPKEAENLLRNYISDGNLDREQRIIDAASVCEDYRQWALEADLLSQSERPGNEITRGIALRRSFYPDEADSLFASHFARTDLSVEQVLEDVQKLCDAGYGETAAEAMNACKSCTDDVEISFKAAELLYTAGQSSASAQILTRLGDQNETDRALIVRIFNWYYQRNMNAQALAAAEKAAKLGEQSDEFQTARLELYFNSREIRQFERVSEEWIASQQAPATSARIAVAKLESRRSNWDGIITILTPAAEANTLTDEAKLLYFKALKANRNFPELYTAIEKYGSSMMPLSKADYFKDADAETQYYKCLEPLYAGSDEEKVTAELASARFKLEVLMDENSGYDAVERALILSGKTASGYKSIINFLGSIGGGNKAIEYAKQWCADYPSDSSARMTLANLWLTKGDMDSAKAAYTDYLNVESDKPKTIRTVYQEFVRYNEKSVGLEWVENVLASIPDSQNSVPYLEILCEAQADNYATSRQSASSQKLRNEAVNGYRRLLEMNPENADEYARVLNNLNAPEDAAKAFDIFEKSGKKLSVNQRRQYVRLLIMTHADGDKIRSAASVVKNETETFNMVETLDTEQALEYGDSILEAQLSNENASTRIKAYSYLTRLYMSQGNIDKLKEISTKLEDGASNNPEIRLKLVDTALSTNQFEEALRHLTWLQALRPDARDVLAAEIRLARRAPNFVGAQSLLSSTLDAAEGIYHRLDWISEIFEQYGDTQNALIYAEKASASAGSARTGKFLVRLICLNLRSGRDTESVNFRQLISSLKQANQWNSDNILTIAEEAQTDGYYEQAQAWMREAIEMTPDRTSLKRKRLEMAIASESEGQIANSLEKAIEPPAADVMDPLRQSGSIQDMFTAIELFEQTGERPAALSSLLNILPYYIETYGVTTTRRTLESLSEIQSEYTSSTAAVLAKHQLIGDTPCHALSYASNLIDPTVWASMIYRCQDARDSIYSSIQGLRTSMSRQYRNTFDDALMHALVNAKKPDEAVYYAEKTGLALTALDVFKRMIKAGDTLSALKEIAHNEVEPEEIQDVVSELAVHGYSHETVDYIRQEMSRIPETDRAKLSATAILLGSQDAIFIQNLSEDTSSAISGLTSIEKTRIISSDIIIKWLKETPTSKLSTVMETATICASQNDGQHDAIISAIESEINNRSMKTSLYVTASQAAMNAGLYKDALKFLEKLKKIQPASDYVHRMHSKAEAALGNDKAAWSSLEEGARCASQLIDYWTRAAEMHASSSIFVRQNINEAQRTLQPHRADLLTEATSLALESGNVNNAAEFAKAAFASGGTSVIRQIAKAYQNANAISSIPEEICADSTSSALSVQAMKLMDAGDEETASIKFSESARMAPWPPAVYANAIDQYLARNELIRVEQQTALWLERYPHSSSAYAYRAVFSLEQHKTDDAWNDYLAARTRAFETDSWIGIIIRETVLRNEIEFAQKVLAYELSHGSFNPQIWIEEVMKTSLDESNLGRLKISDKELADRGLHFIELVLKPYLAEIQSEEMQRYRFEQLKQKSQG